MDPGYVTASDNAMPALCSMSSKQEHSAVKVRSSYRLGNHLLNLFNDFNAEVETCLIPQESCFHRMSKACSSWFSEVAWVTRSKKVNNQVATH